MSTSKMTFSLASLIVLIALGFIATPAMAAKFADGASVADQSWKQGQGKITVTLPKVTREEVKAAAADAESVLTATLTVDGGTAVPSITPTEAAGASPTTITADGGPLEGLLFIFDPAKGEGKLMGDNAHNAITARALVTYTVAEADGTDTDSNAPEDAVLPAFSAEITKADDLTFGGQSIGDLVLTMGDPITAMVLPEASDGVGPLTYTIDGDDDNTFTADGSDLPTGLAFTQATRLLSGSPGAVTPRRVVTYRVTDNTPTTAVTMDLTFTIEVKARPTGPSFAITKVPDAAYTKDHAIMANTLPMASDTYAAGALTYKLAPLPKGLMFDADTRMLTGTPTEAAVTNATYTVTDAADNEAEVPFKITVNGVVMVTDIANVANKLGMAAIDTITIASTGGTGKATYTVSTLPDGVMFDGKTKIMGTPSRAAAASTEVTVTATDTLGATGMDKFTITVTKPENLAFDQTGFTAAIAPRVFTRGQVIPPTVLPAGTGGVGPYTYKLAGVPAGLNFDTGTRLLSGTPSTVQGAMDHTYTVTDSAFSHVTSPNQNQTPSSITLPISITVKAPSVTDNNAPDFGDATIARLDAMQGTAITGRVLPEATDPDGDDVTYTLEGSDGEDLPAGLMFDDENRALTGTPTAVMSEMLYVYTADDGNGGEDTISFFISVRAAAPAGAGTPTATLPAGGFVVYVRSLASAPNFGTSRPQVAEWAAMPNLHELFTQGGGGSLQLSVTGVNKRQVVFSEVMWAVDEGKVGQDSYTGQQWFEIHNRTNAAVALSSISFTAKAGRPALAEGTDLISNVVGGGSDWIRTKGQNGNSGAPDGSGQKEFVSMFRKRFHNDSAGWNGGEWLTATHVYHPNHKGTPGRAEPQGPKIIGASGVALNTVINEVGNHPSSNSSYEWIELRKKSGELTNLENWVVDLVTGVNAQTRLFKIPKLNDGRYGSILLITKTDPARDDNHPLRGGYNVEKDINDQKNEGRDMNIRYYVADEWDTNLPDNGEFVLILRHGADKTNHEKVEDIAGWHPNLKVDTATFFTNLWPLQGYPAPVSNKNAIVSGAVHRRQHDGIVGTGTTHNDKKDDQVALRDAGWTGVGYKRNANAGNQNGGTPGYPNNALKSNETVAATAAMDIPPVLISEVMYATGERNNIPQWIELRNTSQTVGVNLDGWRITIVNHDQNSADAADSYAGDLVKEYTINGKIPPGQTFLVVAHSGTDNTNLPSERIVQLRNRRGELILSQYGFEITLETKGKDNNNANRKVVDKVGNLAAGANARVRSNPQSYEDPAWMLPMGMNADGDRVSIVRVSTRNNDALNGQTKAAWMSFEASAHENAPESTYYGNRNDKSNPGYTVGSALPVSLSKFRPERMKDTGEIVIRWVTESELNNAGFNILRGEALDGVFTKINTKLIAGQGTTSERTAYTYPDTSAKPNVIYYYQIQDVSLDGQVTTLRTTHLRGNVTAVGKATTTWGDIKALQ